MTLIFDLFIPLHAIKVSNKLLLILPYTRVNSNFCFTSFLDSVFKIYKISAQYEIATTRKYFNRKVVKIIFIIIKLFQENKILI